METGRPSHELKGFLNPQKDNSMDQIKPRATSSSRVASAARPRSAFVWLEPKPRRHQAVKAEAAKRGRDSASLYGLMPLPFTEIRRTCRRTVLPKAGSHRPHRTSSSSRFGRHETGSVIQRLMSDSCQPVPLTLILIWDGKVPSAILR